MQETYTQFLECTRQLHDLAAVSALLSWDQEIHLPPRGVPARARHKAALAALIHEKLCDPRLGDLVAALAGIDAAAEFGPEAAANLRELKRERDRAVKIPRSLVRELAESGSLAQQAWAEARSGDDWGRFAPHLEKLVALKRREAEAVGYTGEPYNALLDEYEPGATVEELDPLFAELKAALVPLIARIREAGDGHDDGLLRQRFDPEAQDAFGRLVLRDMGFDFAAGRLDRSRHPFTEGIAIQDVRITTRYAADNLGTGLFASLHEGGHALYELGLPSERQGEPVAAAVSVGIHESQSRLWENGIGRSREFWSHYLPRLREFFPGRFDGASAEDLYRAANVVRPSLIRIEADEVTYNLHIILRMELERALMRQEIQVADVPGLWREKVKLLLGLDVPNDADGPLQDIHWAIGVFGYFPTYTLGNLYAAQFHAQARSELGNLPALVAAGEFAPLLGWLREKIHRRGSLLPAGELCREVTGSSLSCGPFLDHLESKFGEIYDI